MPDRRMINIRQLIKSDLAIEAQAIVTLLYVIAPVTIIGKLLKSFVPRLRRGTVENPPGAPARDELQPCVSHSQPAPVTKARVKISNAPQLFHYPALFDQLLVTLQLLCGKVSRQKRLVDRF